jgi:hypothetical protein
MGVGTRPPTHETNTRETRLLPATDRDVAASGGSNVYNHRNLTVYLPVYASVESLTIGFDASTDLTATLIPLRIDSDADLTRPVVVCGSSIA